MTSVQRKRIAATVRRYLRLHGSRSLRLTIQGDTPGRYRLPELYGELRIPIQAHNQLYHLYQTWTGVSNDEFARIAREVVAGRLTKPIHRAMYVDHLLFRLTRKRPTVRLYRGISGSYAFQALAQGLRAKQHIAIPTRGADSWTDSRDEAFGFGSVVLRADIPVRNIITSYRTNHCLNNMSEREYIVAFADSKIRMKRSHMLLSEELLNG